MSQPIRVGVSACLLGRNVRYDGGHKLDRWITGELGRFVTFVPVCPEVEAGLGVSLNQSLVTRDWNGKVVIMPLDPPQPVEIGIAVPETLAPAARRFADFAAERAARTPREL